MKEEIKMKTTEIKKQESSATLHFIVVLMLIFFCQAILLTIGAGESKRSTNELNELSFLKPPVESIEMQDANQNHGDYRVEAPVKEHNMTTGQNTSFSMAKMRAFLVPEPEQELELNEINSIIFPGEVKNKTNTQIDLQFMEMKAEASKKTDMEVSLYALERKAQECLVVEKENPLQLEDWMINSKCWCPESEEPLSVALFK
jgi:hypothetical protein